MDIRNTPELRDIVGKVSIFALTEIKCQILLAKKEEARGAVWAFTEECQCQAYRRYGLPCWHTVPTNASAIGIDIIAPFWRLDNWDQGFRRLINSANVRAPHCHARCTRHSP